MHSWTGRCKNRLAAPELEWSLNAACSCWVLSSDTSQTASRWGAPVKGVQGADRGPPGQWRQSGESKDTPPHSRRPRAEMGNAALCPSCHAEKSVQAQGHLQELDRTPDYYGYHSEEALEPGGLVSSGPAVAMVGWRPGKPPWASKLPGRKRMD